MRIIPGSFRITENRYRNVQMLRYTWKIDGE